MKRTILSLFGAFILCLVSPLPGRAWTLSSLIVFPPDTAARDNSSDRGRDFEYAHLFPDAVQASQEFASSSLALTHRGNSNEGPTREIWFLLSDEMYFIGQLGESETSETTDVWEIPEALWSGLHSGEHPALRLTLSEQTAYSSEKVELLRSRADIHFRQASSVNVPEAGTLWMLGLGLTLYSLFRISSGGFPLSAAASEKG